MAWTRYQQFLAFMLVITGSINTLSTKWADKLKSEDSTGEVTDFEHPFLQTLFMFFGETLCLLIFKILYWKRSSINTTLTDGNQNFNPFILMPAAMCDLIGTSIMYVGLTLTNVSSFQMLRGSIIIFVAVLSMVVLNRLILKREWLGIVTIIMGLGIVGLTDALYQSDDSKGRNSIITGDLLIILAQVISACQMVYEEKYVSGLNIPPLQAVGWEGVFGFSTLSVLLVVFYWTPAPPHFGNNPRGTVEDAIDGFVQIGHNPLLMLAISGTVISIAFFNFAGISVTKEISATTRMVLDSVRAFLIWMVSIALLWQNFHWEHLLGFAILIAGMCFYHGLVPTSCRRSRDNIQDIEDQDNITEDKLMEDEMPEPSMERSITSIGTIDGTGLGRR